MGEPRSAQRYLEDLTPGGSEYFDNPKRCYETVVTRIESAHRIALNAALERNRLRERVDALEAEVDRLRTVLARAHNEGPHRGGCAGWTGPEMDPNRCTCWRSDVRAALAE